MNVKFEFQPGYQIPYVKQPPSKLTALLLKRRINECHLIETVNTISQTSMHCAIKC